MHSFLNGGRSSLVRLSQIFFLVCALGISPLVQSQALAPEQQQKLAAVESGLERVQTNYQLALNSAGSGTPKGSAAKLSKMRLDSAAVDMPQLKQWLSELPADQPDVMQLAEQFSVTEQDIQSLDDRITGKNAAPAPAPAPAHAHAAAVPPPAPAATPAATAPAPVPAASEATPPPASTPAAAPVIPPADAPVKMGYQQVDVLKGAQFNLREVQGKANAQTGLMAELQPVDDQLSINYRQVQSSMMTLQDARRKAGFTQDGLNKLPPNGEGVAETAAELFMVNAQLDAAEAYFAPLNKQLKELINPANYPDLANDLKRLNELSVMYRDPTMLETDRSQAIAVLQQAGAAKEEVVRIAQVYLPLMVQQTEEGKRFEGSGNNFLEQLDAFQAAAEQERQSLPAQIRADLAKADKAAEQAVNDQKPMFFTGGIPQTMGFANDKLALFLALDPQQGPAMAKEAGDMQASLEQREESLGALIIQQNQLPPDRYSGTDRAKVVEIAIDAWTYQRKDFEVLSSRIPSESWSRETLWTYSNGTWYFVDRSKLQVQLIVADENNDTQAVIQPINMWMDHQKGDSIIGTPLHSGDEKLQPSSYMLRDKIK